MAGRPLGKISTPTDRGQRGDIEDGPALPFPIDLRARSDPTLVRRRPLQLFLGSKGGR